MKKINFKIEYLLATFLSFSFVHASQAEELATLQELVEQVITSNPEVQAKYHEYTSAGFDTEIVRGNFYPKADIISSYSKRENFPNTKLNRANGTAIPRSNNELVLRQMIFDGFATPSEVDRLEHAQRVRYYELQSIMQETTLEFMRSYIDTLRYRQLLDYAKVNYVIHRQYHDKILERVNAGVARKVDLQQVKGRLALAEANLLTERTNLHDVTARMQRLLGEVPPATLEQPTFIENDVAETATEALNYAFNNNPAILATIEDIQATHKEIKNKEATFLPRFDLEARKNLGTSSDGRYSSQAADLIQLTMNYNIFNGFSDRAAVKQTAEKLNRSKDLRDKACVDTRQIVSIAYNDIQQLEKQIQYREQHRASIESARNAYKEQFDIGQRTLLDLLDSENELFQTKRNKTIAEYDRQQAFVSLYAGQGQLIQKIGSIRKGLPDLNKEVYEDGAVVCEAIKPDMIDIDKEALLADAKPLSETRLVNTVTEPQPVPQEKIVLSNKVVPDVQFETNSAVLKSSSFPVLDNAIQTLKTWGDSAVEVGGHTDRRKTSGAAYNQRLSERRARAVMDYLIANGIDAGRLTAKGYGFTMPVAENDPITGNPLNRRVELVRKQ